MQKLNKILPIILLLSFISLSISKEMDKNDLFNKLKKEYYKIETVHLLFSMDEKSRLFGELYAQKGGKMRLSLNSNIIISDGATIWNINPGSSVSISNYESSNEFSLENIFFDLIKELEPIDLKAVNKSNSSEKYNLLLKPKDNSTYKEKLKSLNLYFDSKQNITKVNVLGLDGSSTLYYIKSLDLNPKFSSEIFTYKPDGNIEVIDFR